jgi:hypothetical protein
MVSMAAQMKKERLIATNAQLFISVYYPKVAANQF